MKTDATLLVFGYRKPSVTGGPHPYGPIVRDFANLFVPGAHPINDISIEFEIRPKFGVL